MASTSIDMNISEKPSYNILWYLRGICHFLFYVCEGISLHLEIKKELALSVYYLYMNITDCPLLLKCPSCKPNIQPSIYQVTAIIII